MNGKDKVYVVLVNYNGFEDTIESIKSLFDLDYESFQILVVDNASTDDSIDKIYDEMVKLKVPCAVCEPFGRVLRCAGDVVSDCKVIFFSSRRNDGFAAGNNIAMRYAMLKNDFSYIWLLNNDAVVDKKALSALVEALEKDHAVGAAGSMVFYFESDGLLQSLGSRIDEQSYFRLCKPILNLNESNYDIGQFTEDFEVDDIMGASLLVRRSVIDKVGLMPEEYFLYGEETDWNFCIKKNGYKLMTIHKSSVFHKKGRSTGGDDSVLVIYYRTRNQFILQKKYMSPVKYTIFCAVYAVMKLVRLYSYDKKRRKALRQAVYDGLMGGRGRVSYFD